MPEELKRFLDLQMFADGDDKGSDAGGDGKGDGKGSDAGGDGKGNKDGGDTGDKKDQKDQNDKDGGNAGGKDQDKDDDKLFTQEDLNSIVDRRMARAKKKWQEELEVEKKKAAMTETEKLKAEKEEADKKAATAMERANQRLIKSEVIAAATKLNVVDPDAAYALMDKADVVVDDDGNVSGVKEALDALVKSKPYLIGEKEVKKTGDDTKDTKDKKGGISMNDLIRKAAGRS